MYRYVLDYNIFWSLSKLYPQLLSLSGKNNQLLHHMSCSKKENIEQRKSSIAAAFANIFFVKRRSTFMMSLNSYVMILSNGSFINTKEWKDLN